MTSWHIILIPIGLMITGLVRQLLIVRKKRLRLGLAEEFLRQFIEWFNCNGQDPSIYNWLLNKSETVQTMLGACGLVHLRRPFESGYHPNCPIILNGISEIAREWRNDWRDGQTIQTYAHMVDSSLRRFIGSTEEQYRRERTRLFNPLVLFCGGVAWLMELPLVILSETKIITASRRAIIANGRLFSLASGIVASPLSPALSSPSSPAGSVSWPSSWVQ
jgi:hypothetical protein